MARNIQTLPFPDWLLNTDCKIIFNSEGISEDGEPINEVEITGKCIFSEHSKRVIDSTGKEIILTGKCILKGDIAPSLKNVSDGEITINNRKYEIFSGSRPKNPNGSVYSTNLELK